MNHLILKHARDGLRVNVNQPEFQIAISAIENIRE